MPRIARLKSNSLTYHIISRGNNKMKIFIEESDYKRYLEILNKYQKKFTFWIFNFVLMPNHVHQLLKAESDISKIMQGINLSYAQYFKFKYKHFGHFWQDRFKSYIVEDEKYLLTVARYIERNPLRAEITTDLREYKYSSYNFYAYGENCGVKITPNPLYLELFHSGAESQKQYREFIQADFRDGANDISLQPLVQYSLKDIPSLPVIVNGQFIGSSKFAHELIKTKLNKRIKLKRGRPRKNQKELILNVL